MTTIVTLAMIVTAAAVAATAGPIVTATVEVAGIGMEWASAAGLAAHMLYT